MASILKVDTLQDVNGNAIISSDGSGNLSIPNLTTTGDINFGDNDKAVFGASSDLQIYHDSSNSIIEDVGTGNLILAGNTQTAIRGTSSGDNAAVFNIGADVKLYYNGAPKLETTSSGVDVTGVSVFSVANTDKLTSIRINPTLISGQTDCKVAHVTKSIAISHTSGSATNTDFLIVDSEDEGWCTAYVMYAFHHTSGSSANYYSANWSVGGLSTTPGAWANTYSALLDDHFGTGGFHVASAVDSSGTLAFRHTILSGSGNCAGVGTMHAFYLYATTNG